ncbi:MAG TPA: RDD family protein [Steroidobacter sp.]
MNATSPDQANPYAPPQAEVRDSVTQEESELAGRGERFGAAMLDGLVTGIAVVVPLLVGFDWTAAKTGNYMDAIRPGAAAVAVIAMLALIGITIHLVNKNGQTIGKKICGIKVVRSDFSRASLGRIFWMRNVVNALPGMIPYLGNVYSLVDHAFIFNERRQCVHDKIADTIVIKA